MHSFVTIQKDKQSLPLLLTCWPLGKNGLQAAELRATEMEQGCTQMICHPHLQGFTDTAYYCNSVFVPAGSLTLSVLCNCQIWLHPSQTWSNRPPSLSPKILKEACVYMHWRTVQYVKAGIWVAYWKYSKCDS